MVVYTNLSKKAIEDINLEIRIEYIKNDYLCSPSMYKAWCLKNLIKRRSVKKGVNTLKLNKLKITNLS